MLFLASKARKNFYTLKVLIDINYNFKVIELK